MSTIVTTVELIDRYCGGPLNVGWHYEWSGSGQYATVLELSGSRVHVEDSEGRRYWLPLKKFKAMIEGL